MSIPISPKPLVEANRITKMLDMVFGDDRFDRHPVDVENLSVEYSRQIAPHSPIHQVVGRDLPGCVGALVYSDTSPRQWGILYDNGQPETRRAFTIAHEFGHYVLHRGLVEQDERFDGGIYCDENSVDRRAGEGIEKEADQFAAALLMPFHDFRRQISSKEQPSLERLGEVAKRYGVSLTAAILRWLEYTESRSMLILSNEGFALWAKSSEPALKSGRYIRTKNDMFELPQLSATVRQDFGLSIGVKHPVGVWFNEPATEMCFRSDRYDQEITLLHFEGLGPRFQSEEVIEDVFDRFNSRQ
ncbi:ImmA/IrrE family metallo-endopeptidase [Agrobacterium sp. V1]|uniref:ImmA/IrrE family metallo-endopeptidase n=1 Tax=Agrobacterium sp. V1 TaxID=3061957 RepID=UPI0026724B60|nr:ImmA/IrrE family metallo-endopeptidase [Agrobacterium sp. V1]MDO3441825.1 ImmA/IrrE family metallo-endopeptidase [Agrobacterium sp. V1]